MTATIEKCMRCRKRYRGHGDWNSQFDKGREVGLICPACQTPEEHAEAVINEATIDYSKNFVDDQGRRLIPGSFGKAIATYEDLATDMSGRINDALLDLCRDAKVQQQEGFFLEQVVDLVESRLPENYPYPSTGTRREALAHLIHGELLELLGPGDVEGVTD